jgi:hypothetical protein
MVSEKQLRALIREELSKTILSHHRRKLSEANGEVPAEEKATTTGAKKAEKLLGSSALNAFKSTLENARSKEEVKQILNQVFAELGEKGQNFLKVALKELVQEY